MRVARFPRASSGERRLLHIRLRAATSTTTGGRSNTHRDRAARSLRVMPVTRGSAGRRMRSWSPTWALTTTDSRWSGAELNQPKAKSQRQRLAHYRRQCVALWERGVAPVVTFHHFTNPIWLAEQGGWETEYAIERFGRYCRIVGEALGDVMARACTINEPNNMAAMGWHAGLFPPGKQNGQLLSIRRDAPR